MAVAIGLTFGFGVLPRALIEDFTFRWPMLLPVAMLLISLCIIVKCIVGVGSARPHSLVLFGLLTKSKLVDFEAVSLRESALGPGVLRVRVECVRGRVTTKYYLYAFPEQKMALRDFLAEAGLRLIRDTGK